MMSCTVKSQEWLPYVTKYYAPPCIFRMKDKAMLQTDLNAIAGTFKMIFGGIEGYSYSTLDSYDEMIRLNSQTVMATMTFSRWKADGTKISTDKATYIWGTLPDDPTWKMSFVALHFD